VNLLRRAFPVAVAILGSLLVRVLARLRPQCWCPPGLSLRLFRLSSQPSGAINAADVRRHLPANGWITRTDLEYAPGTGRDGRFDLVVPDSPGPHPLVVWLHGGGWHFGDKADALPYLEHLATRGFAGAAVNYPRAPRARYPEAPRQANEAVRHLVAHAAEYGIDPDRIVLAGDSAGAQLAAELVVLTSNPSYAPGSSFAPALSPGQLRGALLFCGIYDPPALDRSGRMFEAVLESAMWSLTRSRAWKDTDACRSMTVIDHATAAFPPAFLCAGNQDPLTPGQSLPMAARLRELGVEVEEYFPGDETDPVNHEFQFRLATEHGREALERTVAFLDRVTSRG
jgi:acetyl esterase/lipase